MHPYIHIHMWEYMYSVYEEHSVYVLCMKDTLQRIKSKCIKSLAFKKAMIY